MLLLVNEVTVIGEVAPVADWVVPPSLDVQVAVKLVMTLPPSPFAVKATIAELLPRVTPVRVGASGAVPATNDDDAADAVLSAIELLAITVQVYVLPFDSVAIVIGELSPRLARLRPPLLERHVRR